MYKEYYKLVRDNIPAILKAEGNAIKITTLSEKEYKAELDLKLDEEIELLRNSPTINSYVDIIEVLKCMAESDGVNWSDLMKARDDKEHMKGSFSKKVFLLTSESI